MHLYWSCLLDEQVMPLVVDVLDDLFGLPMTLGAVGVLEGRQCAPGRWCIGQTAPPSGEPCGCGRCSCSTRRWYRWSNGWIPKCASLKTTTETCYFSHKAVLSAWPKQSSFKYFNIVVMLGWNKIYINVVSWHKKESVMVYLWHLISNTQIWNII